MLSVSQSVVTFLLNSVWEITLVFAVAQIGLWTMSRAPARFRYRGWMAATLLAGSLPLGSLLIRLQSSSPLSFPLAIADQRTLWIKTQGSVSGSNLLFAPSWMYPLVWCYFVFLAYRLAQLAWAWRRTRQLRESAYIPEVSPSVLAIIDGCRSALEIKKAAVRCSSLVRGPSTIGFWTPQILLPADVLKTASQDEWLSMLSHEMAHVRRNDFMTNLACEVLCLPISFHPLTVLMKSRLAAAREIACDELATGRCIKPERYARSLIRMAEKMFQPTPDGAHDYSVGVLDGNCLEERIMKLLHGNPLSVVWSRVSLALVLASLTVCISASAYSIRVGNERATTSSQDDALAGQDSNIPRVGPGFTAPHPISTPDPVYPKAARDAKREGTVQLWCVIGADGKVQNVRVIKSMGHDLDESSMTAVRKWKFEPAMKAGAPIAVQVNVETTFRLYK
jgi:TonB family protein